MTFTCEKCGAKLRMEGGEDFANATAEHLCGEDTVDMEAGVMTWNWVLQGVKNPERYALKGPAVSKRLVGWEQLPPGPAPELEKPQ